MNRYAYIPLVAVLSSCAVFKGGNKKKETTAAAAEVKPDKNGVKPYSSVITGEMVTYRGFITVHSTQKKDTVYLEIDRQLLGKDVLAINRIAKIAGGFPFFATEELDEKILFFEKGQFSNLKIRQQVLSRRADSSQLLSKAVAGANTRPVLATCPILAYGKDSSIVIDATPLIRDASGFMNSIDQSDLQKYIKIATFKDFEVESVRTFPENIAISISKNGAYEINLINKKGGPMSLVTTTSFIKLPETPMATRFYDQRVGYFAIPYVAYKDDQQKIRINKIIHRWRLEPKPEDVEKYKRGELVEPARPIVIYIDPATPKQWRKFLVAGINDWQPAFEKAGFKNAIIGKEWPENDSAMSLEDMRYSVLQFLPSRQQNAYGPNVHDPRSGEILHTRIEWYQDISKLLHAWYVLQVGPADPGAQKGNLDDELMGELMRFVSSHEVGHTLGLRHNFGSSSKTPSDSLRSKTYLQQYGHTASIMDYARFNYAAQPEDSIPRALLFPRVGDYDKWAIQWGYRQTFAANPEEDRKIMARMIKDSLAANERYWFGNGEQESLYDAPPIDPRCQTEDLGDDAVKANTYGIMNMKRVFAEISKYSFEDGGQRQLMHDIFEVGVLRYLGLIANVSKYIGGVTYEIKEDEDEAPSYEPVPKEKQVAALDFVINEFINTPTWLVDPELLNKINMPRTRNYIEDAQLRSINIAFSAPTLNEYYRRGIRYGADKTLTADEIILKAHAAIWGDLQKGTVNIDDYHCNMQKAYLACMFTIFRSPEPTLMGSPAFNIAASEIAKLKEEVKKAIPLAADAKTRMHLEDLDSRIRKLSSKLK
ncbi:hypothetical protein J2T02_004764 [Chitinophaga terrae (ex Kim and Jung 2007)]|uniref:zinc-dependent metalloprotease n=1 Tax=Chitinophaga terrae (ex Kim and Jung 2007) TaxID=408074 RepID=UPI0027860EB4|nr:zinc-dependent metalloprotease [Chitinophaga terrae (ex Kim and Jung 2007)]MDQ0109620.1 hypothetical protein [Chitinophaga terrae (ex Kim and Jung 2007)]